MLLFELPIAIIIGILIGRYYTPKSRLQKVLLTFLIPAISGFLINSIIAAASNSGVGFWFDYGRYFMFVAIPAVILFITLLITLKIDKSEAVVNEPSSKLLHYGTGDERVEFEVALSEQEIAKMDELQKQDPDKWRDNEYELVKEAKRQLGLKAVEIDNDNEKEEEKEEAAEAYINNIPIVSNEPSEPETPKVELIQNGITVSMELSKEIIEQMTVLRQESPQKWIDNEVELVRTAKKRLQGIVDLEEPEKIESGSTYEKSMQSETSSNPNIEVQPSQGIFGNKLESEYRRETKADSHWIRQDDTEICINIEEAVYRKMVELQNENPKRWVNKELDLYQKAKKALLDTKSKSRKLFN